MADQILEWKEQIQEEINVLLTVQSEIKKQVEEYLSAEGNDWSPHYEELRLCIAGHAKPVDQMLSVYGKRFIHIASHYDSSCKASTLVTENYEKIEECVEVTRTELRDLIKKIHSFTTLEMDYYDKLLGAWKECVTHATMHGMSHGQLFYKDYENYRNKLNLIHRCDQIKIFCSTFCSAVDTIIHIKTKLLSILENRDNIGELKKLWEEQRYSY